MCCAAVPKPSMVTCWDTSLLTLPGKVGWTPSRFFGYRLVIELYFSPAEWEPTRLLHWRSQPRQRKVDFSKGLTKSSKKELWTSTETVTLSFSCVIVEHIQEHGFPIGSIAIVKANKFQCLYLTYIFMSRKLDMKRLGIILLKFAKEKKK